MNMLRTVFVVPMVLWLLGFSFHVGGGLIHILLVGAVIWLVWNLVERELIDHRRGDNDYDGVAQAPYRCKQIEVREPD
jgi:hypothetical protein